MHASLVSIYEGPAKILLLSQHLGQGMGFQDKLDTLLHDAEKFAPGSDERTNSLEQIRSMILER
jgi:hypothetical protein